MEDCIRMTTEGQHTCSLGSPLKKNWQPQKQLQLITKERKRMKRRNIREKKKERGKGVKKR